MSVTIHTSGDAWPMAFYFDLVTDYVYRTVQLMQHKGMKEMYLITFVNFSLVLPIFLN